MRSIFLFVGLIVAQNCFAGDEMPSVVVHKQSKPAATVTVAPAETPAAAVTAENGAEYTACNNCESAQEPALICVNGRCGSRLYSVNTLEDETSRNRLFGGKVIRKHSRTVVRPVR